MGDAHDLPVRRTVLAGIGAAGVAAAVAGCGGSGSDNGGGTGAQPPAATTGAPQGTDTGNGGGSNDNGDAIKVSDIPVGGGKIFDTQNIVVTQPSAGQFKAFSATCTHQGCQVGSVQGGVIKCPCHGSTYSIVDGSVKVGPAPRPLPAKTATVQGDTIVVS
jgi:Rieske Fe-S protein